MYVIVPVIDNIVANIETRVKHFFPVSGNLPALRPLSRVGAMRARFVKTISLRVGARRANRNG